MLPIEIRHNRFLYLIPIPFCFFLMYVFYWVLFVNPEVESSIWPMYLISVFVFLVGAFMIVVSIKQFLKNPVVFRMDDEGIEVNEAGVSSGFIRWQEIREIKETMAPGRRRQSVLAVYLKDPSAHSKQYGKALQPIVNLSNAMNGTAIYISAGILGKEYSNIRMMIEKKIHSSSEQEIAAGA